MNHPPRSAMQQPTSVIDARADRPITLDVSTDSGTNWLPVASDAYFLRFDSSAAGDPGKADEAVMSK